MIMFPKLSEKAVKEINSDSEAFGLFVFGEDYRIVTNPQKAINSFMSLFDRKKYPVTREMLFDFLRKGNRFHDDRLRKEKKVSTSDIFSFKDDITKKVVACYKDVDDINYVIDKMCREVLQCDIILFIGHIHGWFEKGDKP